MMRFALALQQSFERKQQINSKYSLRAFARYLDLSPATLSLLISGKRQLSEQRIREIAEKLSWPYHIVEESIATLKKNQRNNIKTVDAHASRVISDWYYFAFLSLIDTDSFKSELPWIAKRLSLSKTTVEKMIDTLVALGMIRQSTQGISSTGISFTTSDDVSSKAVKEAHYQNLRKAEDALTRIPVDLRDFTAVTFTLHPDDLPEVKRRIRKFRDELARYCERRPGSEVYRACVQLFPLTLPVTGKEAPESSNALRSRE